MMEFPYNVPTHFRAVFSWDKKYMASMYFFLDGKLAWITPNFTEIVFTADNLETWA